MGVDGRPVTFRLGMYVRESCRNRNSSVETANDKNLGYGRSWDYPLGVEMDVTQWEHSHGSDVLLC